MENKRKILVISLLLLSILCLFFGALINSRLFFVVFMVIFGKSNKEDNQYDRPAAKPEVIKTDNSSKPVEQKSGSPIAGILVSVTFLIIGVAIYIYGDYMSSRYQLMHSLLHMYNSEYAQYAFMKIIGSIVAIVGLLGIIITPFMKR
jgi:hypothetical protein